MGIRHICTLATVVGVVILSGCSDGEQASDSAGSAIRLDALAVGQVTRYEVFVGREYARADRSPFEYVGGVLVAEIVDEDADGFIVNEFFESRPMVPEHLEEPTYLCGPEDGLVRAVEYSAWTGEGVGYDRLTGER